MLSLYMSARARTYMYTKSAHETNANWRDGEIIENIWQHHFFLIFCCSISLTLDYFNLSIAFRGLKQCDMNNDKSEAVNTHLKLHLLDI